MWRILYFPPLARAQLGEGEGETFFENKKSTLTLEKMALIVSILNTHIKFTIQNVVLRVLKKKTSKFLLECPNFTKPPLFNVLVARLVGKAI